MFKYIFLLAACSSAAASCQSCSRDSTNQKQIDEYQDYRQYRIADNFRASPNSHVTQPITAPPTQSWNREPLPPEQINRQAPKAAYQRSTDRYYNPYGNEGGQPESARF